MSRNGSEKVLFRKREGLVVLSERSKDREG